MEYLPIIGELERGDIAVHEQFEQFDRADCNSFYYCGALLLTGVDVSAFQRFANKLTILGHLSPTSWLVQSKDLAYGVRVINSGQTPCIPLSKLGPEREREQGRGQRRGQRQPFSFHAPYHFQHLDDRAQVYACFDQLIQSLPTNGRIFLVAGFLPLQLLLVPPCKLTL